MLEAQGRAALGKDHGWDKAMRCLGSVQACLQLFFTNKHSLRENVVFAVFEMEPGTTAMEGLVIIC